MFNQEPAKSLAWNARWRAHFMVDVFRSVAALIKCKGLNFKKINWLIQAHAIAYVTVLIFQMPLSFQSCKKSYASSQLH